MSKHYHEYRHHKKTVRYMSNIKYQFYKNHILQKIFWNSRQRAGFPTQVEMNQYLEKRNLKAHTGRNLFAQFQY